MAMAAAAVPYLLAASTAVSAIGAIHQGSVAKRMGAYNAAMAEQNATLARQQAAQEASQVERENILRLGAISANQGASGGVAGEGSVLDVIADVARQGEMQRQHVLFSGEMAARGEQATAATERYQGRQAFAGGFLRAGSDLLSGGAEYGHYKNSLKRV